MPNKTITKIIFAEPGTLRPEMFADPKLLGANTVALLREKDETGRSRYEVATYRLELKPRNAGDPPGVNWVSIYALLGDPRHIETTLSKADAIRSEIAKASQIRNPPASTKEQGTQSGKIPGKKSAKNAKRRARRKRNKLRKLREGAKTKPASTGTQTEQESQQPTTVTVSTEPGPGHTIV